MRRLFLDEAQAVKNRNTKRSKTVMSLQGDFRLITTGTPVENHLGELWNLFNFINPGLLGNHDFFNERFALPIEKNKDENSRKTLQKLIKPFILRRRKNQVLDDLPAKTEILLTVEMSAEERAFYESLRREALEKIEEQDGDAKDKRFRILAELTRLRLACCHPKLVSENVPISSSKLELFGETLEELLENKHKALVFSQFVKHLKIVREYLDAKAISYQYLDGSTPPNVRQERIDEFQRGTRRSVFNQPQSGRHRLKFDRRRLRYSPRSVVESGGRGSGNRPRPPHRTTASRHRLSSCDRKHGRRKNPQTSRDQTRSG